MLLGRLCGRRMNTKYLGASLQLAYGEATPTYVDRENVGPYNMIFISLLVKTIYQNSHLNLKENDLIQMLDTC